MISPIKAFHWSDDDFFGLLSEKILREALEARDGKNSERPVSISPVFFFPESLSFGHFINRATCNGGRDVVDIR